MGTKSQLLPECKDTKKTAFVAISLLFRTFANLIALIWRPAKKA